MPNVSAARGIFPAGRCGRRHIIFLDYYVPTDTKEVVSCKKNKKRGSIYEKICGAFKKGGYDWNKNYEAWRENCLNGVKI